MWRRTQRCAQPGRAELEASGKTFGEFVDGAMFGGLDQTSELGANVVVGLSCEPQASALKQR